MTNPLDWAGAPFLAFYATLAAIVFVAAWLWRLSLGPATAARAQLNDSEWAYLAGGAGRVGDVALLRLMRAGATTLALKTHKIEISDNTPLGALGAGACDAPLATPLSRAQFQRAIAPMAQRIRRRLQALGLTPSDEDFERYRFGLFAGVGFLLALGACKAMIGVSRNHGIGFLLMLLAATLAIGWALAKAPSRTRAGEAALRAHRDSHARATRAPLEDELLLALALTGPVVLSGTAYAAIYDASRTSNGGGGDGGSGCSGGGNGCGGGGCGGCS